MLEVDPGCWEPPNDNAQGWLEEVMRGVTTGKASGSSDDLPSDAIVEARAIVLEVVVEYLAAGRRERSIPPLPTPPQGGPPATGGSGRVMQFFPERKKRAHPKKTPKKSTQAHKNAEHARQQDARLAVETSAAWAVAVWGLTAGAGGEAGPGTGARAGSAASKHRRRRRRQRRPRRGQDSPAITRARLLAARLLAEVVEACGLPVREACVAIRDQMNMFSGVPGVAGAGASAGPAKGDAGHRELAAADAAGGAAAAPGTTGTKEAGRQGLGAAARGGLVRALFGRPFCPELARVLRDDLGDAGDGSPRGDDGGVSRLRALLSRALRESRWGKAGPGLPLLVGG